MKAYDPSSTTQSLIEKAFLSHPGSQEQQVRLEKINEKLLQTAKFLSTVTPDSEEQRRMIDCIRQAHMWAKEAIHKNEIG